MNKMSIICASLLIMAFFQSGCVHNVPPIDATLQLKPLIEKVPTTTGIYYSNEFQSYECIKSLPLKPDLSFRIMLGAPSVDLFDQILSEMFEKSVLVSSLSLPSEAETDIKATFEPKIADVFLYADLNITWIRADINYIITLYDLKGVEIANWSIKGSGSSVGYLKSINPSGMVREAAQIAMRNVAAQFMLDFRKNPEAKKWLRSFGITASK